MNVKNFAIKKYFDSVSKSEKEIEDIATTKSTISWLNTKRLQQAAQKRKMRLQLRSVKDIKVCPASAAPAVKCIDEGRRRPLRRGWLIGGRQTLADKKRPRERVDTDTGTRSILTRTVCKFSRKQGSGHSQRDCTHILTETDTKSHVVNNISDAAAGQLQSYQSGFQTEERETSEKAHAHTETRHLSWLFALLEIWSCSQQVETAYRNSNEKR